MSRLTPFLLLVAALVQAGDLKLSSIFSDHAVLQAGEANVYGKAKPGAAVEVVFGSAKVAVTAGADGVFKATLTGPASAEGKDLVIKSGDETHVAHDVIVGEVWVGSGQSNMDWTVGASFTAKESVAKPRDNGLRVFFVQRIPAAAPVEDVKGSWKIAGPDTVAGFSAAAYYFASTVRAELKQPVGMIVTSIGGTRAEAWGPRGMYDAQPAAKGWQEKEDAGVAARVAKAKTDPKTQAVWSNGPHMNWNGMVHPLVGYSFKGAIWYQGESNAGQAVAYKWILGDMIKAWHKAWGREFPFIIVQLPRFMAQKPVAVENGGWPDIRESMEWIADHVPGAMMSVNIDLGDQKDIHPKDKFQVGDRLAAVALQRVYKTRVNGEAPRVQKAELVGDAWVVTYDRDVVLKGDGKGWAVQKADGTWAYATAKAEGAKVSVSAADVKAPKAARYAWANFPEVSVFSAGSDALPAGPWRSDK
jgi:sialate O-acetylesterase